MAMQDMNRSPATSAERMAPLNRFTTAILESENVVPVVLEFHQPPVAVYKCHNPEADATKYQADLCQQHQEFLAKLQSLGVEVKLGRSEVVEAVPQGTKNTSVQHDFTYVFNGVGVLMPGRMVASVAKMADVRAVTLNRERIYLNIEKNIPFTGATKLWERVDAAGKNIKGEGITVAIIDTGVV